MGSESVSCQRSISLRSSSQGFLAGRQGNEGRRIRSIAIDKHTECREMRKLVGRSSSMYVSTRLVILHRHTLGILKKSIPPTATSLLSQPCLATSIPRQTLISTR